MSIIVSNCQHCDEQKFQNTVMCTLHDFLSSKVRFIHTSTVIGSDSSSGKKLCVRLAYILFNLHGAFYVPLRDLYLGETIIINILTYSSSGACSGIRGIRGPKSESLFFFFFLLFNFLGGGPSSEKR